MSVPSPPLSTRAGDAAAGRGGGLHTVSATSVFLRLAPALLAGALCARAWALWLALPTLPRADAAGVIGAALLQDLLVFGRELPLLFLLSWPLLRLRDGRVRIAALALLWSLWLLVQVALEQYFLAARLPLGADLFGYGWSELRTTAGGARTDAASLAGWVLPVLVLLVALAACARHAPRVRPAVGAAVLAAGAALWLVPLSAPNGGEDARNVAANKLAFFAGDSLRYAVQAGRGSGTALAAEPPQADVTRAAVDPEHPFARREDTPDVLGPYFRTTSVRPPNLVFIVVEGLGRSFSGPDAPLGSFTPFLDELAGRSLYWSNFLATQGRTFGVMPSVFASLPHGDQGFAALGERMPAHAGLPNVLARQGYASRFYLGTSADFDNTRTFLRRQNVATIVDEPAFGAGYRRNPHGGWGYDDSALIARVLADGAVGAAQPGLTIIQTMSMHTPYRFAGQDAYRRRFEARLEELQLDEGEKAGHRRFADIYTSILFTDEALRRYFDAAANAPGYENTIFVVTGDHRLPEIPMDTKIERYHVPLIVFSPLLERPQRFRAVASHQDIAPSLLALLSARYGLARPAHVAWTGRGLDTGEAFASRGEVALKQAKTLLTDFVAGPWFLSGERLYRLEDNLRLVEADDENAHAHMRARLEAYLRANGQFARTLKLAPEGATPKLVAYAAPSSVEAGSVAGAAAPGRRTLFAHDVDTPEGADDAFEARVRFTNAGQSGEAFVPLLVISDASGTERRESYAAPLQLRHGESGEAVFHVEVAGLESGRYFVAVLPSHPDTGQRVGDGVYRVPLKVRCCGPGSGARARP